MSQALSGGIEAGTDQCLTTQGLRIVCCTCWGAFSHLRAGHGSLLGSHGFKGSGTAPQCLCSRKQPRMRAPAQSLPGAAAAFGCSSAALACLPPPRLAAFRTAGQEEEKRCLRGMGCLFLTPWTLIWEKRPEECQDRVLEHTHADVYQEQDAAHNCSLKSEHHPAAGK